MDHFIIRFYFQHVDEPTEIFIVNLKTGEVQDFKDETVFSQHHINAFESSDGNQIYLDISPGDFFGLRYKHKQFLPNLDIHVKLFIHLGTMLQWKIC